MNKNITISISGMNLDIINTLENKYTENIKITNQDDKSINLSILDPFSDDFLLLSLENFLNNLGKKRVHTLTSSCTFDEANCLIIDPIGKKELTSREVMFLKMLLLTKNIVTYTQMINTLWKDQNEVSSNAVRLFVRNIKKKLPSDILKNFQDIGYKLIL